MYHAVPGRKGGEVEQHWGCDSILNGMEWIVGSTGAGWGERSGYWKMSLGLIMVRVRVRTIFLRVRVRVEVMCSASRSWREELSVYVGGMKAGT